MFVRSGCGARQGYDAAAVRGTGGAQHRQTGSPPAAWGAEVTLPTDSFSRMKGSVHYRPRREGCLAAGMRKIAHYGEKKQAAPHITHKCKDLRPHSTKANGNQSQSERSDAEGRRRGPSHNLKTANHSPDENGMNCASLKRRILLRSNIVDK